MSTKLEEVPAGSAIQAESELRTYRAPWKGQLVLACGKCQKKLRRKPGKHGVAPAASLKKNLKTCASGDARAIRLSVLSVPCLGLCPKGGVAVCTQAQLSRAECSIVRGAADVRALYAQSKHEAAQG